MAAATADGGRLQHRLVTGATRGVQTLGEVCVVEAHHGSPAARLAAAG